MDKLYLNKWAKINKEKFINSENIALNFSKTTNKEKAKELYQFFQIKYPKFYKMDVMSKFGFLLAENLLKNINIEKNNLSLIFSNASASLDTDKNYYEKTLSQKPYQFQPSVFVYTLPNIVQGEVCIRHKINGENVFLINSCFNPKELIKTIILQNKIKKAKDFLVMWLEVYSEKIDLFGFISSSKNYNNDKVLNYENIKQLYIKSNF